MSNKAQTRFSVAELRQMGSDSGLRRRGLVSVANAFLWAAETIEALEMQLKRLEEERTVVENGVCEVWSEVWGVEDEGT